MIAGRRVLAVIPARGGSKGVPRKNIRAMGGKPLLEYTVEAARQSRYLDHLLISTEDGEVQAAARSLDVAVLERPLDLAQDNTPGVATALHALATHNGYDYLVLLQPTSPLRTALDIDGALAHCLAVNAPACVSVCEAQENPLSLFTIDMTGRLNRHNSGDVPSQRQELPRFYLLNGAVYVADTGWLVREKRFVSADTVAFVMPAERSLDIDTETDVQFFEFLCKTGMRK